jgi:hypothetical protein
MFPVQQIQQFAYMLAEMAPHVGQRGGIKECSEGQARRVAHHIVGTTRGARTSFTEATCNPAPCPYSPDPCLPPRSKA